MREKLIAWLCEAMIIFDKRKDEPEVNPFAVFADHLLDNSVTVQKWIPVTERLPNDDNERVLVFTKGNAPIGNQRMDTDRYRRGEWVRYGGNVTHWMPMPQPPKEE